jgi:phosphoenolpyruvate phosphomutase
MRETARQLHQDQHLGHVEPAVAPLAEVFRLQREDELADAERRYMPVAAVRAKAVILAASRGQELGELTRELPKCMLPLGGRPLLGHILASYRDAGITDLHVVRGYGKQHVALPGATYHDNDAFAASGEVASLACAATALTGECVISYGDVLFQKAVPQALLEAEGDFTVAVDPDWRGSRNHDRHADLVRCSVPSGRAAFHQPVWLAAVGADLPAESVHGEWMGFLRCSAAGTQVLAELVAGLPAAARNTLDLPGLLGLLLERGHAVGVCYSTGQWLDVDAPSDLDAEELERTVARAGQQVPR